MHDVADHAIVANDRWRFWCRVKHRIVLDAGSRTDSNLAVIAAQYGACPNC
jgi:hypothetical protein